MIVKKISAFPILSLIKKIEITHQTGACARLNQMRSYADFNPFSAEK